MRLRPASVRASVRILVLVTLAINVPGLWRGRILDDHAILDACRDKPAAVLVTDGLTLTRQDVGDPWWIGQDALLSYFRPLLLLSYKAPAVLAARPDVWQHAVNLALHVAVVLLVFGSAHRVLGDRHRALVAALLFAVGTATLPGAQWISGRKEPLTALLILVAFRSHLARRTATAAAALGGALLTGEQAVAFPVMAITWDLVRGRGPDGPAGPLTAGRRVAPWLAYVAVVLLYLAARAALFRGGGWPVSPYFVPFDAPGYVAQTLFRLFSLLFSLTTTWPYLDRWMVEVWIDHPPILVACAAVVVSVGAFIVRARRRCPPCLALLLLALVSAAPVVPMAALPFYLYTPSIFFAMAAAGALAPGPVAQPAGGRRGWSVLRAWLWPAWITATIALSGTVCLVLSWGTFGDLLKPRPDVVQRTARLLEEIPAGRNVLLVDVPAEFPTPLLYLPRLLGGLAGRDPATIALVSDRPGDLDPSTSVAAAAGERILRMRAVGRPYFHAPSRRWSWFFAEGVMAPGRVFARAWYSVTIVESAPPGRLFGRGLSFYSRDEGIAVLDVTSAPGAPPPVIIAFRNRVPYVLVDMGVSGHRIADPPAAMAEDPGILLRPLARGRTRPPRAVRMPDQIVDVAGPKAGLGPLLAEMSTTVPAFRRAYHGFLRYLDDLNTRLAAAGGGPFRMSASNPGPPYYARAIEALGGMSTVVVKSNQIGVTADSLMDTARRFAAEAIAAEGEASGTDGPAPLVDLLALAEIAAVANRVIPADYEREWRRRHPEIRPAPETPPAGIPRSYWDGVRLSLAYMYHAGALPWLNAESENQLAAFDTDHFFSHAWLVQYGLWRRARGGRAGPALLYSWRLTGRTAVVRALAESELAGWGYEVASVASRAGLIERTPRKFLPGPLRTIAGAVGLETFPFVEAVRDLRVGRRGALYGAALAVSERPLRPSAGAQHRRMIDAL